MNGWHMRWALALAMVASANAQWLNYRTAGVPRLPNGEPNLSAPAPRAADGKPDLSGLWLIEGGGAVNNFGGFGPGTTQFWDIYAGHKEGLPYQPWAAEVRKARQSENSKTSPGVRCLPVGILQMHTVPFPRRIVQAPGYLAILHEREGFRQIFTDGRPCSAMHSQPGLVTRRENGTGTPWWCRRLASETACGPTTTVPR